MCVCVVALLLQESCSGCDRKGWLCVATQQRCAMRCSCLGHKIVEGLLNSRLIGRVGGWRFQISNQVDAWGRGSRLLPVLSHRSGTLSGRRFGRRFASQCVWTLFVPWSLARPSVRLAELSCSKKQKKGPSLSLCFETRRRKPANSTQVNVSCPLMRQICLEIAAIN